MAVTLSSGKRFQLSHKHALLEEANFPISKLILLLYYIASIYALYTILNNVISFISTSFTRNFIHHERWQKLRQVTLASSGVASLLRALVQKHVMMPPRALVRGGTRQRGAEV